MACVCVCVSIRAHLSSIETLCGGGGDGGGGVGGLGSCSFSVDDPQPRHEDPGLRLHTVPYWFVIYE